MMKSAPLFSNSKLLVICLLLGNGRASLAFSSRSLQSHSRRRGSVPRTVTVLTPSPAQDENDQIDDPEEFLQTAGFLIPNDSNSTAQEAPDPLQIMANITQQMVRLSGQFEYQASLAKDDQTRLLRELELARTDRNALNSLVSQLRREQEGLAQTLQDAQLQHQRETQEFALQIQSLRSTISQQQRDLETQRDQSQQLNQTIATQREQLRQTKSSARRLLVLLWKLLQRRILPTKNWILLVSLMVYELVESPLRALGPLARRRR